MIQNFEIERSLNGIHFDLLDKIQVNAALNYEYTSSFSIDQNTYYRLKIVDYDGLFTYSPIITIAPNVEKQIIQRIYPQPATQTLFIDFNDQLHQSKLIQFQIINALGQLEFELQIDANQLNEYFEIDIQDLPSGIYWLRAWKEQGLQTIPFR